MRTLAALSVLLGAPFAGFAESGASAAPEASAYRAAEAALEREASSEALRLLEGATDPLGRWLRARALLTAGQSEDALAALGPARGGRCLPVEEDTPDIIVLDWMMPNLSGIEVCRRLKTRPETRGIPIIMLSARSEEVDRVRGALLMEV